MAEHALRAGSMEQAVSSRKRLVVRGDGAAGTPLWWAAIPALGMAALTAFAVGPFAKSWIEGSVRDHTRQRLEAAGMPWVDVTVSGQAVVLAGVQPLAGAGDKALDLARQTACPTWLGPLSCPMVVTGLFTGPLPGLPTAHSPASAAGISLPSLPGLPSGPTRPATAEAGASAHTPSAAAAAACEQRFARLLSQGQVRFGNASARIAPGNEALLDELARTHRECPMALTIEGHTDNVGSAESNRALSQARAEAVRQALITRGSTAGQLVAKGLGLERPVADNTTPEGRARNRRIEFRATANNN